MKKALLCFLLLPCFAFSQKIEGYVRGMRMRMIDAATAELHTTYYTDDKLSERYYRLIFMYNDGIGRIENAAEDGVPITAPSISWLTDFLNYNGWEKISINEDVQNLTVTIYAKKKATKKPKP